MDPVVISSIINAVASVGKSLFEGWSKSSKKEDEKLDKIVKDNYEKLRIHMSDPCVRILRESEDRQNHDLRQLREAAYPGTEFSSSKDELLFNKEFDYRLKYLQIAGVLSQAGTDYFITPLGMAFLREARIKKNYFDILFRQG